ncbi:MAG: hypothetical protein M0P12_12650 [Paludibacteraceae bacterium]|nr:hypothetical protein [Paludibacteraceae bacterium]
MDVTEGVIVRIDPDGTETVVAVTKNVSSDSKDIKLAYRSNCVVFSLY